jgi:membrane-associated phospholipid phosphatase
MSRQKDEAVQPLEALVTLDGAVSQALAPHKDRAPMRALGWIGKQGDQPQMIALSGLTLAAGLFRGNKRVIEAGGRMLAAHLLATGIKHVVKRRVDRRRPSPEAGGAKPRPGRRSAKEWTSFPSGHTAGAVAVAQGFARAFPEHRGKATSAAAVVALAQVCKQAHYVSDVAAGVLIGLASEAAVDRLARRFA